MADAEQIQVGVLGARGRMGTEVCRAVEAAADMTLAAAVDTGDDRELLRAAEVVVDFTTPEVVLGNLTWALENGLHLVIGTTGFTDERIATVRQLLTRYPQLGIVIAANFSIGAALMMRFAALAAPYYESVEVIEMHHPNKVDAPSGTARATVERIATARKQAARAAVPDATTGDFAARGADQSGVRVHSVRLRGLVAHQEVLFGDLGETLTIRHDSLDRASFMPGVLTAVRAVRAAPGLHLGMDELLRLGESE